MSRQPLMPKATAVWLVDNTSLTFEQIAEFCNLHVLEVKGIADGDVAQGIKGMDPIASGQLTRDEIKRGQEDSSYRLKLAEAKVEIPVVETKKGPRYTPVSRRQDRPNAILWLLRSHPELRDSQVMRLVGTTKPTIQSIRERTHWNSPNLQPSDPVTLGLCSQTDLDKEVKRAARRLEREQKEAEKDQVKGGSLLPADKTTGEPAVPLAPAEDPPVAALIAAADMPGATPEPTLDDVGIASAPSQPSEEPVTAEDAMAEAESVFAKLKELKLEDDSDASDEPSDAPDEAS